MKYIEYMKQHVTEYWKNAKIDYDIDGEFIACYTKFDRLYIEWVEMGQKYTMFINYYATFTPEQCYNIWMDSDWSFWAD